MATTAKITIPNASWIAAGPTIAAASSTSWIVADAAKTKQAPVELP